MADNKFPQSYHSGALSSDNPYRIALIPFQGESGAAKQANEIVKNDLIRTGEFYIFDEKGLKPFIELYNAMKRPYANGACIF